MRIKANTHTIYKALSAVNAMYDNNIKFGYQPVKKGNFYTLVLRAVSSKKYGARLSSSGRHTVGVSWEAHRDFMQAIFNWEPDAIIHTSMATYRGKTNFEEMYPDTAYHNVGSRFFPVSFQSLSL